MAELALYEVTHRNFTTTMQLSEEDAEALGATRVGDVKPGEPQPVTRPSHAVDESAQESTPAEEKKAPASRNKARSSDADKS